MHNSIPNLKERLLVTSSLSPPHSVRSWGRDIDKLYEGKCLVTGLTSSQTVLEKHHLYSQNDYPSLKLEVLNGVILSKDIHRYFHKIYQNDVTPIEFLYFLKLLKTTRLRKISNQIDLASYHVVFLHQQMKKKYNLML